MSRSGGRRSRPFVIFIWRATRESPLRDVGDGFPVPHDQFSFAGQFCENLSPQRGDSAQRAQGLPLWGGAPRSESIIYMVASGNHTMIYKVAKTGIFGRFLTDEAITSPTASGPPSPKGRAFVLSQLLDEWQFGGRARLVPRVRLGGKKIQGGKKHWKKRILKPWDP